MHLKVMDGWPNNVDFQEFLEELHKKIRHQKVALFLDNASIHHVKAVKQKILQKMKWLIIYNEANKP